MKHNDERAADAGALRLDAGIAVQLKPVYRERAPAYCPLRLGNVQRRSFMFVATR